MYSSAVYVAGVMLLYWRYVLLFREHMHGCALTILCFSCVSLEQAVKLSPHGGSHMKRMLLLTAGLDGVATLVCSESRQVHQRSDLLVDVIALCCTGLEREHFCVAV